MKVWTVILAVVHLAALSNLGNGVLEDAGVFMSKNYTKFERRVLPARTFLTCNTDNYKYEWFRINMLELSLLDFERGNNSMKATFSLGTPSMLMAKKAEIEFGYFSYCKYTPMAYRNATPLINMEEVHNIMISKNTLEYFAVKVNDTERATIKKGWNYLINVVKNRFPYTVPADLNTLVVEKTAAGVVYVGVIQGFKP